MSLNDSNATSESDNAIVEIASGDQSGHRADVTPEKRLKVDALISGGRPFFINNKLRYIDMNATSGGVARGTNIVSTWTDVFSFTGNGYFFWFLLNLESSSDWEVRFIVDNAEIFSPTGLLSNDIKGDAIYDQDVVGAIDAEIGISWETHDVLNFHPPLGIPMYFDSSIVIKVKRADGKATKKFRAGLVALTNGI